VTFPRVGVVGGGQLARMLAPPAVALGVRLRVLAEAPDASAAQVVPDAPVGAADDASALLAFARDCAVVTFDHEHVPQPVLAELAAAGVVLRPGPGALLYAQDKAAMRARLSEAGIPCPRWALVRDAAELAEFAAEVGWPVVLKTPVGGYDG
jgi:5-(carboxyamino)imidazole ribonucleotide synthase